MLNDNPGHHELSVTTFLSSASIVLLQFLSVFTHKTIPVSAVVSEYLNNIYSILKSTSNALLQCSQMGVIQLKIPVQIALLFLHI